MKRYISISVFIVPILAVFALHQIHAETPEINYDNSTVLIQDFDWNSCIQKKSSEWGKPCKDCAVSKDSYKVFLENVCDKNVDCMACVQGKYNRWKCFYRYDLKPGDTFEAYACIGTGKYLRWVRAAGDENTEFPSNEEVNRQYKD